MIIRKWAVEVMYPPIEFTDSLPELSHGGIKILKRFWSEKSARNYQHWLNGLKKYHPSEAYRREHEKYAYYVVRSR